MGIFTVIVVVIVFAVATAGALFFKNNKNKVAKIEAVAKSVADAAKTVVKDVKKL